MTNERRASVINIDHMKGFGDRLVAARRAMGLRQVDLAGKIGVRPQTVYRFEKQGYIPARRTIEAILAVLPVSEPWLMHGVGPGPETVHLARAIDEYLRSAMGQDTPPEVRRALFDIPESGFGSPRPTQRSIHRMRETIETNLAFEAQQHDDGDAGG